MERPRTQIQQKNVSDSSTGEGDDLSAPASPADELQPVLSGTAPVGAYRTDAKGQCTWVNEKWCELTGISHHDARGNGWQRAIHPDDFDRLMAEWNGLPSGGGLFCSEYRYLRPDGSVRWVLGRATEEQDETGTLIGFVGVCVDITELRQRALVHTLRIAPKFHREPTARELDVARLLARGLPNKQIGIRLGISVRTVEAHRASLMRKLRLKSIAGLVRYAISRGLVSG